MAELPLSDFHEAMRIALHDEGVAGSWEYLDDQLNGALRTVVKSGMVPNVGVKQADPLTLSPAPENPDTWGFLMLKACLMMRGGRVAMSVKSRAMSESVQPQAIRETVQHFESLLAQIEARGNVGGGPTDTTDKGDFAGHQDIMTACRSIVADCYGTLPDLGCSADCIP